MDTGLLKCSIHHDARRREVEIAPSCKSPGTCHIQGTQASHLPSCPTETHCAVNRLSKIPFKKSLVGSVCQLPRHTYCHHDQLLATEIISMNELQRNTYNRPSEHATDPRPRATTVIPVNQDPAMCQVLC